MIPAATLSAVAELLLLLEKEMRDLEMWSEQSPSRSAMASENPFCFDTMPLEEWLQWVFIKQLKAMLEQGERLPERCEITPYAEETWQDDKRPLENLLRIIQALDGAINSYAHSSPLH